MANFNLPESLENQRNILENTACSFLRIALSSAATENDNPYASKLGGRPYLPKWALYPMDADLRPLFFLAQINLADLPEASHFPKSGILQFYISGTQMFGMDMQNLSNQSQFRVLYYDEPFVEKEELTHDFSFLPVFKNMPIRPAERILLMSFSLEKELASVNDVAFAEKVGDAFFDNLGDEDYSLRNQYKKLYSGKGHKMGGYGFFAQDDPRTNNELLLLQLDTDPKNGIEWGDMGAAHFFIGEQALRDKDFSKVGFHWDCY